MQHNAIQHGELGETVKTAGQTLSTESISAETIAWSEILETKLPNRRSEFQGFRAAGQLNPMFSIPIQIWEEDMEDLISYGVFSTDELD